NAAPTREQILHELRGSLCRCTGYRKILDAVESASARPTTSRTPEERHGSAGRPPFKTIGRPVQRIDALEKVTGRARYVTDLVVPGMPHARVLRSPHAHARLVRVDATQARALPGVVAVLTGGDLGWCDPYYGPAFRDRPILAVDRVRFEGEPVAAVAAV